ncbi:MAG: SPOR domain-containing protein [Pseudomonadota bacterium]
MDKHHSRRTRRRLGGLLGLTGLALAGCDSLEAVTGSAATPSTTPVSVERGELRIEERDVEAPDVFALRDRGLWDGRPSLGGIWVAVPQRVAPDRVKIVNRDNDRSVVGGLFRKEVDNPGPAILVSADAAAALGMQAGTPAPLELVVLRRETVEIAPPPPVVPIEEAVTEPAEAPDSDAEAVAAATATLLTASAPEPAAPVVAPSVPEGEIAAAPLAPAAAVSTLDRPYVQVATLDTPAEANAVVQTLQAGGLSGELRIDASGQTTVFSVVVGPALTEADRTETLDAIRALGFDDALAV